VFYPRIFDEPKIFQQEGWHMALESAEGEIGYNGVVYNEMKGSFSSPTTELYRTIGKNLFPHNTYGFTSGGYPEAIPDLTYKAFLAFHRKYYHPSNSFIFLYGDGDTAAELAFLDQGYLSKFSRKKVDTAIPIEPPFARMREATSAYPISSAESETDKSYLSLAFVAGTPADPALSMSFDVLTSVLANLPAAPLRKALRDAGIGKDVYASYWGTFQPLLMIVATHANESDRDRFREVVLSTLGDLVKQGIDKKLIEGVINSTEFGLREADFGGYPKGLVYNYRALEGWMFTDNPYQGLEWEHPLEVNKQALTQPYLEGLIQKYLLQNPHSLLTVVKPQKGLSEALSSQIKDKLSAVKAGMKEKERIALVEQTQALKLYQQRADAPGDIEKIPLLTLADIAPDPERLEVQIKEVSGVKILFYPEKTQQILYLQLLLDATVVPQPLIPYAALLTDVISELNSAHYSYGDLDSEINIHTGGLSFGLRAYLDSSDDKKYFPKLVVACKAFQEKLPRLIELLVERTVNTRFAPTSRLKEVLNQVNSRLQMRAQSDGVGLATTRLESYYSPFGMYEELTSGLSYTKFVSELTRGFDGRSAEIATNLEKVAGLLFNKKNLVVGLTCAEEQYPLFEKEFALLLSGLGQGPVQPLTYAFPKSPRNEGLLSASKVQYVTKGYNFRTLGYPYSGKLKVLAQILSREYLQQTIREQGGAYGAWASFDRSGLSAFTSYRDPNLRKTLLNYDRMVDFLKGFQVTEREMTRFIIGTIAKEDRPMSPSLKGRAAVTNHLQGLSFEDRKKERQEILRTSQEDIQGLAPLIADILKQNYLCVYGNETEIQDNKDLFQAMTKVVD